MNALLSEKICSNFEQATQTNTTFDGTTLTAILVESKSNYDRFSNNEIYKELFLYLKSDSIYSTQSISNLINETMSRKATFDIFYNSRFSTFYTFHKSLQLISKLNTEIYFNSIDLSQNDNLASGYIVFEMLSEEQGQTIDYYSKVLNALREILDALSKILDPKTQSKIVLLDSGSGTNIGIQTGVAVAQSLFQIFKEVWDWVINHKHYKNKTELQSLLDNLDAIKKVQEHENYGTLSQDEAQLITHTLKSRIPTLIGLNTVPKTLTQENFGAIERQILLGYRDTKMLESNDEPQSPA